MSSNQVTIAASYAAVCAKASRASVRRVALRFDEPFWHVSVPLYAQWRFPIGSSNWDLVAMGGFHYFFEFDDDDFAPLTVDVSTDGGEFTEWFGIGAEYVWR